MTASDSRRQVSYGRYMGGIYHIFYGQYEFLIAGTDRAHSGVRSRLCAEHSDRSNTASQKEKKWPGASPAMT
jgi:hypothetical protein